MLTNQIKPDSNRQTTSGASPWVAGLVVAVSMLAVLLLGASGTLAQWGAGNAVEWNVKADDDTSFSMSITGTGDLSQFKQVVFSDLAPSGGLLAGPISLTLAGDVTAGERIRLVLESNPSTGYRWEIAQMNRAQLGQVGDTAFEPKSNLLGAPAKQMFSIQATQDGHTHLTLVYRRPWDKDSLPTRDITILASRLSSLSDLSNPAAPLMRVETPKPDITSERPSAKLVGLPSAFDWRTTGKVTAVRNQASCGSCWAFGTVAPFESSLLIKQSQTTDFSEQYLVSCNREGWGCDGGWWAHDYHISTYYAPETQAGGVPESAFPYTAQDTSCGGPYSHPNRLTRWRYVGDSSSVPTSDAIKQAIYTYGPVAVAVCVGNAFQAYTDGIFATGETSSCWGGINHAVTLVGWNDTDQYWIMKNSWGADWGENGYMRIRWGTSNIGYSANYVDDTAPTPPSNDDFNNATSVSALPYNVSQDVGDATVAQDDPTLPCVSAQKSNTVWYRYTPSQSGVLTVDTLGSNYDTVLAVWSGARGSLNSLGCNDDASGTQSRVQVAVTQGQAVYIEVASFSPGGGQLTLNAALGTPACYSLTTNVNPTGSGSVTANPAPNCGLQYTNGTLVALTANANSGYTFANWSGDASGSTNPTSVTMSSARSVTANFTSDTPSGNDDFDNATGVTALPYSASQDTGSATTAQDDPIFTCVSGQNYNTVWYRHVPSQNGILTVATIGSNYDTVLAIWKGSRGSLTSLGCNDDAGGTTQSRVQIAVTQGQAVYIEVASYSVGGGQLTFNLTAAPESNWDIKAPMATARSRPAIAAVNGRVYIIGGESASAAGSHSVNKETASMDMPGAFETVIEEYNPSTDSWTAKAPKPTGASNIGAGVINNRIYVPGGFDGIAALTNVDVYDPATNTWSATAPMPSARMGYGIAAVNNKLYVIGGVDDTSYLSTCVVYDPLSNTWTTCAPMSHPRAYVGAGVVNGKIYVAGGYDGSSSDLNVVEEYNPAANTWRTVAPLGTARGGPGAVGVGNDLYVCGGGWLSYLNTCEKYDAVANAWSSFDAMNFGRRTMGLVETNGQLYAEGGFAGTYLAVNEKLALTTTCYRLTTSVLPAGGGSVSVFPAPNCGSQYTPGTLITLTASANSSYEFKNWDGGASGSANPTTVVMNSARNITATFTQVGSNVLAVAPGTSTVSVRQVFSISLQVRAGSQSVDGAAAYLSFDPARLQVVNIAPGTALPIVLQNTYDNTAGQINFTAGNITPPNPEGTFTLATVVFNAISDTSGTPLTYSTVAPRNSDITLGGTSVLSHTENGVVVITSDTILNGSVTWQGRPTAPDARWIAGLTVSLTVPGASSPSYTFAPTTDSSGRFVLTGIAAGTYQVQVKNSHTLRNTVNTTVTAGAQTVNLGVLREGDANNDNLVSLLDFSVLASTFSKCQGATGYDDRADFNEDQCATLLDFSLLATNFGQSGQSMPSMQPASPVAGTVQMVVSPATMAVSSGEVFTLTLQAQGGSQMVDGARVSLNFDPTSIRVVALAPGAVLPIPLLNQFNNVTGTVDYAAGALSNFPSGTFVIAQVRLEALAATSGLGTRVTFDLNSPRESDVTYGGQSVRGGTQPGTIVIHAVKKAFLPLAQR